MTKPVTVGELLALPEVQEMERAEKRLAELEAIIEQGLPKFLEVGTALTEIREHALYRSTHATFEAYCADRWNFTPSRARQLIAGARAVTSGNAVGAQTEREARAMARAARRSDRDELAERMHHAVADKDFITSAADVPEGVRVTNVGNVYNHIEQLGLGTPHEVLPRQPLTPEEYAFLVARVNRYEAEAKERIRIARKMLRDARRRNWHP